MCASFADDAAVVDSCFCVVCFGLFPMSFAFLFIFRLAVLLLLWWLMLTLLVTLVIGYCVGDGCSSMSLPTPCG